MLRHRFPESAEDMGDLRSAIVNHILPGYVPEAPFLPRDGDILTLGSCFAETIHHALCNAGIKSAHLVVAESINTPAFADIFVQKLAGADVSARGHISPQMMRDEVLEPLRARIRGAAAFILTVGVAIQPFHEDGLPMFSFNKKSDFPDMKKRLLIGNAWRMLSVDEIEAQIQSVIAGLRVLRPDVPVILTLSPIPLTNSISHPSVFGQDCISKSNIRAALALVMDRKVPGVFYWPSFEMVRWLGGHMGPFFGVAEQDHRHVTLSVIDLITQLFIEHYVQPAPS